MSENYFSVNDSVSWKEIAAQVKQQDQQEKQLDTNWLSEVSELEHGQLALDIYETPADLVIEAPLAGVKPDDLELSLQNDMLTIKGKRSRQTKVEQKDLIYQECHWGSFSRTVILPVEVVAERIEASMKNGILTIRLPKAKPMRKIKVKSV